MDEILDQQAIGICLQCGDNFEWARFKLGYKVCKLCGDKLAHKVRRCIVPMHKSNYVMLTDLQDLKGINNKGGLIK
jgi:predicted amidophosphoribosyltransferase